MDPFALNVRGVSDLVENPINKVRGAGNNNPEGQQGERYNSLLFDMKDEELLKLRDDYETRYAGYEGKMKPIWEKNMENYLGKRKDGQWLSPDGPAAANLQFEAEETFLAAALAKNPEPIVYCDNTPEGNAIATDVKTMLAFHSDQLVLRRKLALMVRQWSIYHLSCLKYGWQEVIDAEGRDIGDVDISNRRIQNFVFDPEGYVDAYGDFIGALGERIEVTAEVLISLFPDHEDYITGQVDGKLGTKVVYTEWWSGDDSFTFCTFKDEVLSKNKNHYFKYQEESTDLLSGAPTIDPLTGVPTMVQPRNHFSKPKKPYTFLSVFSLQEQPHDVTGLIEQNMANQKKITDRSVQVDYNVAASNNGYAYSEENFNQETAKQASTARAKGNPIMIPAGGPIEKAIMPLPAQSLPDSIFREIEMTKNDLRSSWGIQGISPQEPDDDQTARGMILNQAHDTTRIGGGIGAAIEQVADSAFNWLVQLYYVFYDEEHFAAIMGGAKAVEFVTLSNQSLDRQLIVSVAPDSLKPKDEVTQMNLAQSLFQEKAIGPKTLLKMLDFPNPDEAAADGVLYNMDPATYFRINFPEQFAEMQQAAMQTQQEMMAGQPAPGQPVQSPEQANGEPAPATNLSSEPASAQLSQVPLTTP